MFSKIFLYICTLCTYTNSYISTHWIEYNMVRAFLHAVFFFLLLFIKRKHEMLAEECDAQIKEKKGKIEEEQHIGNIKIFSLVLLFGILLCVCVRCKCTEKKLSTFLTQLHGNCIYGCGCIQSLRR